MFCLAALLAGGSDVESAGAGSKLLRYLLYRHVIPLLDDRMLYPFTTGKLFLAQSVWRGVYYTLLSAGYFFALNSIRTEQEGRRQVEQEKRLREVEKTLLEAKILNLKSQINGIATVYWRDFSGSYSYCFYMTLIVLGTAVA